MANKPQNPPIGLVSMPWVMAKLPSIQLATLDAALRGAGLSSERHELFLDFCAQITPALYLLLTNSDEFLLEWLFARDFYGNETGNWLVDFEPSRPRLELPNPEHELYLIEGLKAAVSSFLDRVETDKDWALYDIVGFSVSTQQLGASIAMARRIKKRFPTVRIVFGGSVCANEAGNAILELCPYVDAVVRSEGEVVLPELIRRWRDGKALDGLNGVSHRDAAGLIVAEADSPLFQNNSPRPFINYDPYFEKLERHNLKSAVGPMMSFESSRGCWWGEKSQCSFCGLHEIMKYRPKHQEFVLEEMEHLATRHNHTHFYAVDLIAPKDFFQSFFPEIKRRGHKWQLFYEMKSNVSRDQLLSFVEGGGQVLQPGIESLQQSSLKRMHKGAHVLQNIQLLKWCREINVMVYWNYLTSLPGEDVSDYDGAAEKVADLYHLEPPTTIRDVFISRYAPFHKNPEEYGIENLRPHSHYQRIFPSGADIVGKIAYLFEADWEAKLPARHYTAPLKAACVTWQEAARNGARLDAYEGPDGGITIIDTRGGVEKQHNIIPADVPLYLLLDEKQLVPRLMDLLRDKHPSSAAAIAASGGISGKLRDWRAAGLVIQEGEQILALAVKRGHFQSKAVFREQAEVMAQV